MKILVTGGAGFIGSHVVDAYVAEGHDVTVVDDLSKGRKANLNPEARFLAMDVRDPALDTLFAENRFDVVNHHASQIDVRRSVEDPHADASINILGALSLLEKSRAHGVRRFIFASSGGAIYGECGERGAREEDVPRPESPYGISKLAVEHYIRFFGAVQRLPYTILRYANVYGPRQDPRGEAGVITLFIDKILAGEAPTIYGSGAQVRDYVHVEDVVEANRAALRKGENQVFNIGTGVGTSVNELFEILSRHQPSLREPRHALARPGEVERSLLNAGKAAAVLGWKASRPLDAGLYETLLFFRRQRKETVPARAVAGGLR